MVFSKQFRGRTAILALSLTIGLLVILTAGEWKAAHAASPQTQQQLNNAIQSLHAVESAYSSGNTSEAHRDYDKAKSSWTSAAPTVSKKEAQELQVLFDTLGGQLSKQGASDDVKSTISDMIDELQEHMK